MNQITIKHKFDVGETVYHITPESPPGIVLEWTYYSYSRKVRYKVVYGHDSNNEVWCDEIELTEDKIY